MTTISAFLPKIRALFSNFWKRAGKTSPPSPSSYAPVECQYWSSEQICLELIFGMSSFLNIRSSRPEVSLKTVFLKLVCNFVEKILHHICFTNNLDVLTLIRLGYFRVVFTGGASIWPPFMFQEKLF